MLECEFWNSLHVMKVPATPGLLALRSNTSQQLWQFQEKHCSLIICVPEASDSYPALIGVPADACVMGHWQLGSRCFCRQAGRQQLPNACMHKAWLHLVHRLSPVTISQITNFRPCSSCKSHSQDYARDTRADLCDK